MSAENFLKITYHGGTGKSGKINAYLQFPSPTYMFLLREIENCIFQQHKQPETELRSYWIDEDNDEIEIVNQCDYEIFLKKRAERRHLQVAPVTTAKSCNDSDPKDSAPESLGAVHRNVTCDGCSKKPLVGFRYKCIQCPNYDLCGSCEGQNKHSEHMMVRMPNDNCPSIIEAWISGAGRRHKRGSSGSACPFVFATNGNASTAATSRAGDDANGKSTPNEGKEHNHHGRYSRKHHRTQMQHGIFTHLYNMMHDLAEGGGPAYEEETKTTTNEGQRTPSSDSDSGKNTTTHDAASKSAQEAAASAAPKSAQEAAASAASKLAQEAAVSAAHAAKIAAEAVFAGATLENPNTGAIPKTPPPTPNTINVGKPVFRHQVEPKSITKTIQNPGNNEATNTTVIGSPKLENVDPQYMKAGIQILNNFSEMFARWNKMLDPVENSSGAGVPVSPFSQNQRNNSFSSPTPLNGSTISSNDSQKSAEKEKEAIPIVLNTVGAATNEASSSDRSHSEETDWQIIENHNIATVNESLATVSGNVAATSNAAGAAAVQTQTAELNYAQLGRDLQAHMQQEQKKEQAARSAAAANAATSNIAAVASTNAADAVASTNAVTAAAFTNTGIASVAPTNVICAAADATTNTAATNAPDPGMANALYHWDSRIDKAVKGMMSMGFSNEGNWLTQLLESVDGDIPKAVDLLSSAQRGS